MISGLTEIEIENIEKAIDVYYTALINRKREQTVKNILSSRSHAIFQVRLYSKDKMDVDTSSYVGGSVYNKKNVSLMYS